MTPAPRLYPRTVPLTIGLPMAVCVPVTHTARVDCFIDDLINCFLDTPENRARQPHVVPLASENNHTGYPCWGHGKNPIFTCFDPGPHIVRPQLPCYRFTAPHATHGTPPATPGLPGDPRVPRFYLIRNRVLPTPNTLHPMHLW